MQWLSFSQEDALEVLSVVSGFIIITRNRKMYSTPVLSIKY